ncbi:MAG: class I SAM-dependent rRNA methyltransferase [Clostridiales bacterium]|jgi:23S rRNA (cytosine1962-C5)-methyltransferase|nr:class I SAM-dependent rRNA methyltransferase [Clostridiales bacterium]
MTGTVYLKPAREARVLSGHPWIFSSDIDRAQRGVTPGDVVRVQAARGRFLGHAAYNPNSQITLRMLNYDEGKIDSAFIKKRVREAIGYRRQVADTDCCRLIFAESDGLPAVIADTFAGVISLQILSLGMARFEKDIVEALVEELAPRGVWERNDVPIRELEGMMQSTGLLWGDVPDEVEISENGLKMMVNVKQGQKTGHFLDQKENRAAIAPFCPGAMVLDICTHTGGFALHAAMYGASEVIGVDLSEHALAGARNNAKRNGFTNANFVQANAFDFLRAQSDAGNRYDLIILDPPAFAKNKPSLPGAAKGYKEINLRALKMLQPGGILVTCSCSQAMLPERFRQVILEAAYDAGKALQQVEWRGQGRDHPVLVAAPETHYLKCGIFRVLR